MRFNNNDIGSKHCNGSIFFFCNLTDTQTVTILSVNSSARFLLKMIDLPKCF